VTTVNVENPSIESWKPAFRNLPTAWETRSSQGDYFSMGFRNAKRGDPMEKRN